MATEGIFSMPRKTDLWSYTREADFHVVSRMITRRLGYSLAGIARAMGYKSTCTVTGYLKIKARWSMGKRNLIEAARDMGATRDEMAALVAAYVRDAGDVSFLRTREDRSQLAGLTVHLLDSRGDRYLPHANGESHVIDIDFLRNYKARMKQHMRRGNLASTRIRRAKKRGTAV